MAAWVGTAAHWLHLHYHRNWVDALTWLTALVFVVYKACRTGSWKLVDMGRSFMDGMAVFPLLVLSGAAVWRGGVEGLLEASRPTLSIAGFFALMAILTVDKNGD